MFITELRYSAPCAPGREDVCGSGDTASLYLTSIQDGSE
jgi:hypothetical protein